MLLSVNSLYGYRIGTTDGLGAGVVDFYFNDQNWSITQIVISNNPARWNKARLLAPASIHAFDHNQRILKINLTRAQTDALPSAVSLLPVSRQYEQRPGSSPFRRAGDPHLRCATAVAGCQVYNSEKLFGIVDDFLIDAERWTIAFFVIRNGLREFKIPSSDVKQISFAGRRVALEPSSLLTPAPAI